MTVKVYYYCSRFSVSTKANSSNSSDIVGKQKLTPKTVNNAGERPTLDFFGRVVQPIKESQKGKFRSVR